MIPENYTYRQVVAIIIVVVVMLWMITGCASNMLANRVVCTLDGRGAQVISQWGPFGLASSLSDSDITAICQRIREPIAPPIDAPASAPLPKPFKGWT